MARDVETLVVGAGISGLAYAHARGADADLVVVEASERPGGLIRTRRTVDVQHEEGPEALQDGAAKTRALIDDLGLTAVPAAEAAAQRYVLDRRGRLQPFPTGPGAFLSSRLLTPWGKARALCEPFRARDRALDDSVAEFVRHRLGDEVLQRLVDPAISGIFAGDPEQLSLRAAAPAVHDLVRDHGSLMAGMKANRGRTMPSLISISGGLEALPDALAQRLGARLQLRCAVRGLRGGNGRWTVETTGETWRTRRLVLATPARAAARILLYEAPVLANQLAGITSENVVSVAHGWRRDDVEHALDGFGYLVPSKWKKAHLGTLFSSSIQPGICSKEQVVLRTLMGGARRPEQADWTDDQLADAVTKEVGAVLGLSGSPQWTHVSRWKAALPRYDLDQPARQHSIDALLAERPGLDLLGNHRRGVSVNALIAASAALAEGHA